MWNEPLDFVWAWNVNADFQFLLLHAFGRPTLAFPFHAANGVGSYQTALQRIGQQRTKASHDNPNSRGRTTVSAKIVFKLTHQGYRQRRELIIAKTWIDVQTKVLLVAVNGGAL